MGVPKGRAATDDEKAAVLASVLEAWRKKPELRLGQLLVNAVPGFYSAPIFYVEDDELVRRLLETS